jgi:hypothetical protein
MGERSHDRAQETKSGSAIGGSRTGITATISTVEASVVIRRHGRSGQGHGNARGQVSRPGSSNLRATLGIESEMFAFGNLNPFQAGLYSLFNSIGRHDLVEHDPKLSVAIQPAGWAHFQHRAFNVAALGKQ